ncbi:type II and III secretion system protein family protein [Acetobacter sacchari]|uniref:Type II and III secretion system protein family protein n=1 Tax=Acetobacter sacchari TaxID=2661687 RepID=A0ABS3LWY1_9PROT|nr:type II and III secretion system protein family protein [Acetobacter sacchari]MBO1360431.1 type II and III secretion system protein family protein [Acetobacter sacchari]
MIYLIKLKIWKINDISKKTSIFLFLFYGMVLSAIDSANRPAHAQNQPNEEQSGVLTSHSRGPRSTDTARPGGSLVLRVGGSDLLHLSAPAENIMIADPAIMDIQYVGHDMLYAFGKKPGHTTLVVLDDAGRPVLSRNVTVTPDMTAMNDIVSAEGARIVRMQPSPQGVVVSGRVPDARAAARIDQLAHQYAGPNGQVVNRLAIAAPVQVSLRVRVAEVQRSVSQELGFDWSTVFSNVGSFALGAATGGLSGAPNVISQAENSYNTLSGSYTNGRGSVAGTLDAMASEGLATMLAEPNLTTMSGESATFLSGGQFPVPIPQGFGTVGISYQNYGVSIAFTPTVLSDGTISMHVAPEVSNVTTATADGAYSLPGTSGSSVPAIRTNRAETTIQLASGQSFAIGGLISNNAQNSISKVPGLGDLPVLGALFRSTSFQRNESELIIVVTAYVVHPSDHVPQLPTDYIRPTSALESLLLNRVSAASKAAIDPERAPRLYGAGGFIYP